VGRRLFCGVTYHELIKIDSSTFNKREADIISLRAIEGRSQAHSGPNCSPRTRIEEEIKLIPKANKHQSPMAGKLTNGIQLGRTLAHHQGDACARGGVFEGQKTNNRIVCKSDGLMKLAQTDLDSGIAVEGQAMSGLPSRLETVTKKQFITIPQAVAALANMERELDSAESYAQIRKLADAAEALKILFRHVAEVKNKAELVVLAANARIGDEIKLIPKATPKAGPKKQFTAPGKLVAGRTATGVPGTSRSRHPQARTESHCDKDPGIWRRCDRERCSARAQGDRN
jgi:hypothetical protein